MADLRSELPPGVDVDSLSTEARKELKELMEQYETLNQVPRFEVSHPEAMTVYLQANFNGNEILKFLLEQRNRLKQYLLDEQGFQAYEDVPTDVAFDQIMAADIFVDDMKLLNTFNQVFGEVHSVLDQVEENHDSAEAEEAIEEVRDMLELRFPEDEDLTEIVDDPLPLEEPESE